MDPSKTLNRLQLAAEQTASLQAGISALQRDVLSLELAAADIDYPGRRRAITDQAEDIRRTAQIHREEHIPPVRDALMGADDLVTKGGISGQIDPVAARTLTRIISTCSEQTRRAEYDLADAERALRPIAQANPTEPHLGRDVLQAVDQATTSLDRAHNWSFRLSSGLPEVERKIGQSADLVAPRPTPRQGVDPARWYLVTSEEMDHLLEVSQPIVQAVELTTEDRLTMAEMHPVPGGRMLAALSPKHPHAAPWNSDRPTPEIYLAVDGTGSVTQKLATNVHTYKFPDSRDASDTDIAEALEMDLETWTAARALALGGLTEAHQTRTRQLSAEVRDTEPVLEQPASAEVDYPAADIQQVRSRGAEAERRRPPVQREQRRATPGY